MDVPNNDWGDYLKVLEGPERVPCPKCGKTSNMSYIYSIPDLGHCPFIKCDWHTPFIGKKPKQEEK